MPCHKRDYIMVASPEGQTFQLNMIFHLFGTRVQVQGFSRSTIRNIPEIPDLSRHNVVLKLRSRDRPSVL